MELELNIFDEMIECVLLDAEARGDEPNPRDMASLLKHRSLWSAEIKRGITNETVPPGSTVTVMIPNGITCGLMREAPAPNGELLAEPSSVIQIRIVIGQNGSFGRIEVLKDLFRRRPGDTRVCFLLEKPRDFSVLLEVPFKVNLDREFRLELEEICGRDAMQITRKPTIHDGIPVSGISLSHSGFSRLHLELLHGSSVVLDLLR